MSFKSSIIFLLISSWLNLSLAFFTTQPVWAAPTSVSQLAVVSQDTDDEESLDEKKASPSATQSLKDRIEKVVEDKKEEVATKLENQGKKAKGIIGKITRVSQETLTLENTRGTQVIPLTDLILMNTNQQKVAVADIAVDNWATVLGFEIDEDFQPAKIIISKTSLRPATPKIVLGALVELDAKTLTVKSAADDQEVTYQITKATVFEDSEGKKMATKNFFADMQCLIVGQEANQNGSLTPTPSSTTKNPTALIVRSLAPVEE